MNSLPLEIYGKFVEYATWEVFCSLMFVDKKYHKICKDSILLPSFAKYIKRCTNGDEICEVLPNGVLHGMYENRIMHAPTSDYFRLHISQTFEEIKTTYRFGRIHGEYRKKICDNPDFWFRTENTPYKSKTYRSYMIYSYVNGNAYGQCIIHHSGSLSELKQLGLTYEEALKLPPAGDIMRSCTQN